MKRLITALTALLTISATVSAMSYEQAREQALFLTDKMAYELNLTEEQYDAAYEVNLDYLMSVNTPDDLYDTYWRQRNLDLSYILLDWQYRAFCAASYFYRPLYWTAGVWHFAIYARYPHRHYFYFGRPHIYVTYRGGHSWRHNGGRSWYKGRTFHHGGMSKGHGLRDRFDRGEFHRGGKGGGRHFVNTKGDRPKHNVNRRPQNNRNDKNRPGRGFNGNRNNQRHHRESSTRTTARTNKNKRGTTSFNSNRRHQGAGMQRKPSNTFSPKRSTSRPSMNRGGGSRKPSVSGSRGGRSQGGATRGGGNRGKGNFGGRR